MGISLNAIIRFFGSGYVEKENPSVLDIGCANLSGVAKADVLNFINARNDGHDQDKLAAWAEYVEAASLMDPELGGINGGWLGDLLTRAGMRYRSFDIFPGYKTELFDLNVDSLAEEQRGAYDLVFNLGTTEHVLGQHNAFKVIHDAVCIGGVMHHDLPMTGHLNHGFFNYNPISLLAIAEANEYEILELTFSGGKGAESIARKFYPLYDEAPYFRRPPNGADWPTADIPTAGLSLTVRKRKDAPFRTSLETTTTVGAVSPKIALHYGANRPRTDAALRETVLSQLDGLLREPSEDIVWLRQFLNAYVAAGITERFPTTIELQMIDLELRDPAGAHLIKRRAEVVAERLRRFPLLAVLETQDAPPEPVDVALDGEEASLDLSGTSEVVFARILGAYDAYRRRLAIELFPARLEMIALHHLARGRPRDPDILVRLGKVTSIVTPEMDTRAAGQAGPSNTTAALTDHRPAPLDPVARRVEQFVSELDQRFSSERFKTLANAPISDTGHITSRVEQAAMAELVAALAPCDVLEIGTYFANTTRVLAQAVAEAGGTLTTIDPFGGHRVPAIIDAWPKHLRRVTTFKPEFSMQFFSGFERSPVGAGAPFNLIFVDGHHSFESAYYDILSSARLTRPGGVIVVDNVEQDGPARAIDAFLDAHRFWTVFREKGLRTSLAYESLAGSHGCILLAPIGLEIGRIPRKIHLPNLTRTEFGGLIAPIRRGAGIMMGNASLASFPYDLHLTGHGAVTAAQSVQGSVVDGEVRLRFDPLLKIVPTAAETHIFLELELTSDQPLLIDTDRDLLLE